MNFISDELDYLSWLHFKDLLEQFTYFLVSLYVDVKQSLLTTHTVSETHLYCLFLLFFTNTMNLQLLQLGLY